MKTENLLLLAVAGFAIYYFFFKKDGSPDMGGGGGGGGGTLDPMVPPVYVPPPSLSPVYSYHPTGGSTGPVATTRDVRVVHAAAGSRQRWTGVSYGQPGQPSAAFGRRVAGSSAVRAGAPPRVVAKIKAGKWY